MKDTINLIALALLLTISTAHPLKSDTLSFSFSGTVVELDGNSPAILDIADKVSGSFYYSENLTDGDSSSTFGFYENLGDLSLSGFIFNFGGLQYETDLDDLQRIAISSPIRTNKSGFAFNWLFDAADNFSDGSLVLSLNKSQANYFGSDQLPDSFTLEDFDFAQIEFIYDGHYIRATLDSLTPNLELSAPKVELSYTPAAPSRLAGIEILIRDSVEGFDYTLYVTGDLSLPKENWNAFTPEAGHGGAVNWPIGYSSLPDQQFFYVKVTPNE
jgi:hypothetical protein